MRIELAHRTSNRSFRWCHPVGWEPKNKVNGISPEEGVYWDKYEEIAGLVVPESEDYEAGKIVDVNLEELSIAQSGEFRILIDKVKV